MQNTVQNLQLSIDKRFDEIQNKNTMTIKKPEDQIGELKNEYNPCMEGLSKKLRIA